ncbi:DUF4282 domain-containing protein [Parvibaculum sp.]|jgi:hypothetical protein|uniref:DUF4282 domain-containing protein n=1 Tax=Parvibaculum sp. TaxID=2024848 RepID=UPI000C44D8E5|nr:DUF4282 domain-containing protein [Parvibaculum sp.]HAC59814.1 hypothetical protein [Rhodobiaceae bacterium]MAU61473.1 hypothetical protein [Parvibaculum sp.]MBO6668255.1 DUF4282 domain-containing protein [Parvibaculum sp.]MBO6690999.1 DUF4282 domain-containing protein [Parvibaculum sp.]MBO6714627.1 DUF4282 domain-containing protein [Parvibaculum sp.]|tara:strand:- start:19 stop:321 length:303 start_codon:yes stop_codon:yes gene_type:complete
MSFKDFLSFDKMIAGRATQLLYWLGIVAILLYVFGMITGSVGTMSYNAGLGVLQFLVAIFALVFGIVLWRVICEMYLTFLSMNDRLKEIRDKLPGGPAGL